MLGQLHRCPLVCLVLGFILLTGSVAAAQTLTEIIGDKPNDLVLALPENWRPTGLAVDGEFVHLLVRNLDPGIDALISVNRENGSQGAPRKLPGRYVALCLLGEDIWLLSRTPGSQLLRISRSGEVRGSATVAGAMRGEPVALTVSGNRLVIAAVEDGVSTLYALSPDDLIPHRLGTIPHRVQALTATRGLVLGHVREFEVYADSWLYCVPSEPVEESDSRSVRMFRFLQVPVFAMASAGEQSYLLTKDGGGYKVQRFALLASRRVVLGTPTRRAMTIRIPIEFVKGSGTRAKLWMALPIDRPYQQVFDLRITPRPDKIVTDCDGNRWAKIEVRKGKAGEAATLEFDLVTAAVAFTLNPDQVLRGREIDKRLLRDNTRPTACFDVSAAAVRKAAATIPTGGPYFARVLAVRNLVNDTLAIVGPSGPESRGSDFLTKREGRCYAHTVSFASIGRACGLPVRAIGGTGFESRRNEDGSISGDPPVHTWNQVFFPQVGWVDIDCTADDHPEGEYGFRSLGYRPNRYCLTFVGSYDAVDHRRVFAGRDWIRSFQGSGLGNAQAGVVEMHSTLR